MNIVKYELFKNPVRFLSRDRINKFSELTGIDKAVIYAFVGNLVALVLGPVTAYLIAVKFSLELQGYYYTFGSLGTFQFFLDLGLGQAIIQYASHEWANLYINTDGFISGEEVSLSRLASLAKISIKWYGLASIIVLVFFSSGGYYFFSGKNISNIVWQGPWFFMCFCLAANLLLAPFFYLLQGCGFCK